MIILDEETTEEIPTSTTPKPSRKKKPTRQEIDKLEQEQLLKWTEMHKLEPTPCDREVYKIHIKSSHIYFLIKNSISRQNYTECLV